MWCQSVSFLFLGLCLTSNVYAQWVTPGSSSSCRTPSGANGDCINLKRCAPLLQLLVNAPRPIPDATTQLLRDSQCGFEGAKQVKVCCPNTSPTSGGGSGGGTGGTGGIPGSNEDGSPPDVSSHVNLRLLPHTTCGALLDDRIVRGNKTGLFEFPWMALLAYRSRSGEVSFRCGGTLITDRYVLTAAHCLMVAAQGYTLEGVRLGEHDTNTAEDCETQEDGTSLCADPVQDRSVEETIIHPEYNRVKNYNDIALIRLASPADTTSDSVRPVCLPVTSTLQNLNLTGKSAVVTGWGYTEFGTKSPDLLKVGLPVIANSDCASVYGRRATIISKQVCAGGTGGRDSCGGDSGGPLKIPGIYRGTTRIIQHGIVSYGPTSCGTDGVPGVYTRVAHYVDWILDNLRP